MGCAFSTKLEPSRGRRYGRCMQRLALALALAGIACVALRIPGPYVAIGLAIAAMGTGIVGYRRRSAPGGLRLLAAAAITVGAIALVLGAVRVGLTIAAIDHVAAMLPAIPASGDDLWRLLGQVGLQRVG